MPIYYPLGKFTKLAVRDDVPEYQFNIVAIMLCVVIPIFVTVSVCLAYVLWRARKQAREEAAAAAARRGRIRSHPLNNRELRERLERLQRGDYPDRTLLVCPDLPHERFFESRG
ncbi:hypothetical protein F5Y07DRAFT_398874 [Xylaria sp. FL0933]|nr:hypothetical protein F5Y07DRAFT_398874 [Xylaria sp. FL0933]